MTQDVGDSRETLEVSRPTTNDMRHYYDRYLPFEDIYRWLNHGEEAGADFTNREFAFEHSSGAYQRYLSFKDGGELKDKVVRAVPTRFEVGAVYAVEPRETRKSGGKLGKPLEKELVLDIDVTDYDDIRTCCSGTAICSKCWKFVSVAVEAVDAALREDFGVQNRVWVFSGRRGVHCWVSDKRMRALPESGRRSVVEYLKATTAAVTSGSGVPPPLHPHLQRTLDIAKTYFVDVVLREQDVWASAEGARALAATVPDGRLRNELLRMWVGNGDINSNGNTTAGDTLSLQRWLDVSNTYNRLNTTTFHLSAWKRARVLAALAPRLDAEVTRQPGHLLKAPFCVHPSTGRVCVPFSPETEKPFSPFSDAPTVHQLFAANEDGPEGTLLELSLSLFHGHVTRVIATEKQLDTTRESEESNAKRAKMDW